MPNLKRLSVLVGEADAGENGATAALLEAFGVGHVERVDALSSLLRALKHQTFDVLLCAEKLSGDDGLVALRAARDVSPATRLVLMGGRTSGGEAVPAGVEVIDWPASHSMLLALLQQTASAQGGFWCEVPELSIADILPMYHQARRSITLLMSGPIAGRIHFEAGELVDAEADGERGTPALSRLLEAESGLIRSAPLSSNMPRTISAPFQSVMLEAAHRLDERRRDRQLALTSKSGPPPLPPSNGALARAFFAGGPLAGSRPPGLTLHRRKPLRPGTTSPSSEALRAAPPPTLPALTANSPAFVPVQRRVRRQKAAAISVLASLLFVSAVAFYGSDRIDISMLESWSERVRRGVESLAELAAAEPPSAERPPSTAGVGSPPSPVPPGTSTASRVSGIEAGRALGKSSRKWAGAASSSAGVPRDALVHLPGDGPAPMVPGPSEANSNAAVVLSPSPVSADSPDAGPFEDDAEPARPGSPRARRKGSEIRLRR
jgi:hypothetical protein